MLENYWSRFAFLEIMSVVITSLWYVFDPQHQWEPRVIALCLCTVMNLYIANWIKV